MLLVIVVLWTTIRIPSLMRRFATGQGRGPNVFGLVLRTAAFQGLTRNLGRRAPLPSPRTPRLPRIDMSTHTHHHYRRLRNVYLNRGDA